jgi:hypothetical protein
MTTTVIGTGVLGSVGARQLAAGGETYVVGPAEARSLIGGA